MKPAIIALSETRVTAEIGDSEVCMPGYSVIRCDAENRNTGGAIVYVRDGIKYELIMKNKIESNCWSVAIEVNDKIYKGVIIVVYHSPSASDAEFIRYIEEITEELTIRGECLVIGDFNIDVTGNSFYKKQLISGMLSLGMKQYVNKPTRITQDSRTIIDLVFGNMSVQLQVEHEPKITDHAWIKVELGKSNTESKQKEYKSRNYSKIDDKEFTAVLKNSVRQWTDGDLNWKAKIFVDSIVGTLDIVAPKKATKIPSVWEGKKWYSDEVRRAAGRRDNAYREAIYAGTDDNWEQFKVERNAVVKLIRKKKKEYYENRIDCNKNDPTKMWKTLKELIRGESTGTKEIGNINFEILDDTIQGNMADKFNMFYVESINNIVNSIDSGATGSPGRRRILIGDDLGNERRIEHFENIEIEELGKVVNGLPKKKGTEEGISTEIIKLTFSAIGQEFVDVINESLREGCCPNNWKTSTIIPIPKIEKAKNAKDFRPINMLPLYEKVLELVVKSQIEKYLEINEIITEHQSGFRKQYSCETAIQTVIDEWKLNISEGKLVGVIFMDLKRAFETVDRDLLIEKMFQYGIRGKVLEWFRSYLNNRTQQVLFNEEFSEIIATKYGVPQGSVLGPLLFIIYINDIVDICPEDCAVKMFADDTLIYVTGDSSDEVERKMNEALSIVEGWMNRNKLVMNAEKTKFMIVRSVRKELRGNIVLKCMDGTELERVEVMKYLGVMIDDKIRFKDHCEYILKKIGKKTSFLNRIGQYISAYTRCVVYKAIIAPHFEYCATLLVGMGETELNKLQIAQNRAMRVILQCSRYTRVNDMLQAVQFMSVRQRLYYNVCIFIFKAVKKLLPKEVTSKFEIVKLRTGRVTRQAENIAIQFRRTRSAQKSMFYDGVKMYNALPIEVKGCEKLVQYKSMLKAFIVSEIK